MVSLPKEDVFFDPPFFWEICTFKVPTTCDSNLMRKFKLFRYFSTKKLANKKILMQHRLKKVESHRFLGSARVKRRSWSSISGEI